MRIILDVDPVTGGFKIAGTFDGIDIGEGYVVKAHHVPQRIKDMLIPRCPVPVPQKKAAKS